MANLTLDVWAREHSQGLLKLSDTLDTLTKQLNKMDGTKAEASVDVDTRKADAKMTGLAAGIGSALGNVAANVASGGLSKITDLVGGSVAAFSDLGESVNAVNKIFGDWSEDIIHWGEANANALGLSQRAFQQLATPLGAGLKNAGLSMRDVTKHTIALTERAADMASVFNSSVPEALEAIQAGLRGESDPLERFGVGLSEAQVQAKALSMGLVKNATDLTAQQKALARVALIMEQTQATAGDFRETSDGLANSQRIAAAKTEELQAKIGEKLAPAVANMTALKLKLVGVVADKLLPAFSSFGGWVKQNEEWLKPLGLVLGTVAGAILVLVGITKAWAIAQALLNVVLTANPIGIVIVAIAALVAGIIYAYNHSETFRKIVQAAWQGIQTAVSFAWNIIKPVFDAWLFYVQHIIAPVILWLWDSIVKPVFSKLGEHISVVWNNVIKPAFGFLKDGVALVAESFRVAVNGIGAVWNTIKEKTRTPINFVIGTVINNGLIRAWNTLAGFIGHGMAVLKPLPLIGMASGSAGAGGAMEQMARGGAVPGSGDRDTVPAMLTPGEFVLSKLAVANLGGTAMVAAMHKAARTSRSLAEVLFGGDKSSPGMAYFADGGAVNRGLGFARGQVGKPYIWGGVGPGGYDCSGLMSAIVGSLIGANPHTRRFSTASFARGAVGGFVPGLKSAFSIGVMQGNPGHMAGTLGGFNIEATPPRVIMGAKARGADNPLFSQRFSLPQVGGEFVGGGGGMAAMVKKLFEPVAGALNGLAKFGSSQYIAGIAALSKQLITKTAESVLHQMPGFASGGIVPGPIGRPRAVIAHGGEYIGRSGGVTVVNYGVIASQREAENWLAKSLDNLKHKARA